MSKEEKLFNQIIEANKMLIWGLLKRLVKDLEDRKDLRQIVYMRIWSKIDVIDAGRNLPSYIYSITKNIVIDYQRGGRTVPGERSHTRACNNLDIVLEKKYVGQKGMEAFEFSDVLDGVVEEARRILRKEDFRLLMGHYNGEKYTEMQEQNHLPLGTLKTRIGRARKKMRKSSLYKELING